MTADANMTCLAYVFERCFDEREFTKVIKHGSNMSWYHTVNYTLHLK